MLLCLSDTNWISWLSVLNFNIASSPSGTCVAPWDGITQKLLGMLIPLICLGMLFVTMICQKACFYFWHGSLGKERVDSCVKFGIVKGDSVQFSTNSYIRSMIGLLIFSYTSISKTALDFFKCIEVSDFAKVLASDPSISCTSSTYLSVRAFMIFLVVIVVIGFPLAAFIWLSWMHWHRDIELHSELNLSRFGILFDSYKPKFYFWEVVVLARRSLLISFTAAIGNTRRNEMFLGMTLANIFIFTTHVYVEPFDDPIINYGESISLIFLTCLTSILSVAPQPFSTSFIVPISIFVYGPCLGFMLWFIVSKCKEKKGSQEEETQKNDLELPEPMTPAPKPDNA